MKNSKLTVTALVCSMVLPHAVMDAHAGSWKIGGFVRADYGNGDRYPKEKDEDRFGVTKAAVSVSAKHNNVKGVVVVGTKGPYNGTTNGDMNIKAAFVEVSNVGRSGVTLSTGVQPLRFGLKPNGFKGDRSIQHGVEYGTGGSLPVARQAGPSVIANGDVGPVNIRGGIFQLNASTSALLHDSEASLTDNYFIQAYAKNISGSGVYGVVGYESVYVNEFRSSQPITTFGLGWKNKFVDISIEQTSIDRAINNTIDDERYTVAELTLKPTENTNIYADFSAAEQASVDTYRTGVNYNRGEHAMFTLEYSKDIYEFGSDVDSIDFRFTLGF